MSSITETKLVGTNDENVPLGRDTQPGSDNLEKGDDAAVATPLMLATLTDHRDFGDDWLLERKFDGERCVARKRRGDVQLKSRTGKDLTATYPEVRGALCHAAPRRVSA